MPKLRVSAIIPCHNEEESIEKTILSLVAQSYPLDQIVVIDDASTDNTQMTLNSSKVRIPQLVVFRSNQALSRAGALNFALQHLPKYTDLVLRVDADTIVDSTLVERAISIFEQSPKIGGLCSRAGVVPGEGFLYRLQKLEYGAGFDAERTATYENVLVLHGMCTVFRAEALRKIGGFALGHRIEDYEATLRLKYAGYKTIYHPSLLAYTQTPNNLKKLIKQRYRWIRGGVDIVLNHGVNRFTIGDVLDHLFFLAVLLLLGIVIFLSLSYGKRLQFHPHPISLALGILTYTTSFYRLKYVQNLEAKDVILRAVLLPELLLTLLFSFIQLYAYTTAIRDMFRIRKEVNI